MLPLLASLALPALKLLGVPGGLDQPLGFSGLGVVAAAFLLWAMSLLGWGRALEGWLQWRLPSGVHLASGVALALIAPQLVLLLGLPPAAAGWLLTAFASFGLCLLARKPPSISAREAAPLLVLLLPVGAGTLFLNLLQDVYSYHLYAPLRWWSAGSIAFDPGHPNLFSAQAWENLHFWPLSFFGSSGRALYAVQIFAQLTHAFLGFGLAAWLAAHLAVRWIPRSWAWAAAAAALLQPTLLWTAWYAKNDYGGLMLVLSALTAWLAWKDDASRRRLVLFSLLLGLAVATKLSLAFLAIPLLTAAWIARGERPVPAGFLLVPFLLALTPLLWRNFAATGNPSFPFLTSSLGGGDLISESLRAFAYQNSLGENSELLPQVLLRVWMREPALILGPILGFFSARGELRVLAAVALLAGLGITAQLGSSAELFTQARLLAAPAALGLLLLMASAGRLLSRVRFFAPRLSMTGWILYLGLLLRPHVPWTSLPEIGRRPPEPRVFQERLIAGSCKWWAWHRATPLDRVVWLEDDAMYFTPLAGHVAALHHPRFDSVLRDADESSFLARATAQGATHVVVARHEDGDHYYRFSPALFRKPPGKDVVFAGRDCLVFTADASRR
ncbi:MAG: hypothetical protein HUU37_02470 [Bdellovibrionales bacterium]|nr:hypothetical protein [Bdellovibrionales bacterium]